MDRVSTWFDRFSREAIQNRTQGVEPFATAVSKSENLKTLNGLLSGGKRDIPSTSFSSPRSSGKRAIEKVFDQPLDSSLWSQLPEPIIFLILAYLPIKSLAKFRLVCKKWQLLWNQPEFLSLRTFRGPEEKSWFIFNCQQTTSGRSYVHTVCFNPALNRWHTLNLGPESNSTSTWTTKSFSVVAASGGLMLCAAYDTTAYSFKSGHLVSTSGTNPRSPGSTIVELYVSNPLRENCWLKLPDRPVFNTVRDFRIGIYPPHFTSVGLIVDNATNSFKVVLGTFYATEIYSSRTGCWKVRLDTLLPPPHAYSSTRTVSYKGFLISVGMFMSRAGCHHATCSVFFCDHEEEKWNQLTLPDQSLLSAKRILSVQMEDCEGRLLLLVIVGPRTSAWSSTSTSYNVATPNPIEFEDSRLYMWEFVGEDLRSGDWFQVCSHLLQEIRDLAVDVDTEEGANLLASFSGKDLICCTLTDPILSQSVQLLYSPLNNIWFSVEERFADESLLGNITEFPGHNIRFQPRLEATPSPTRSSPYGKNDSTYSDLKKR